MSIGLGQTNCWSGDRAAFTLAKRSYFDERGNPKILAWSEDGLPMFAGRACLKRTLFPMNMLLGVKGKDLLRRPVLTPQTTEIADVLQSAAKCSTVRHRRKFLDQSQLVIDVHHNWKAYVRWEVFEPFSLHCTACLLGCETQILLPVHQTLPQDEVIMYLFGCFPRLCCKHCSFLGYLCTRIWATLSLFRCRCRRCGRDLNTW